MSVMIEIHYKKPENEVREQAISSCVSEYDGEVTYREDDNAESSGIKDGLNIRKVVVDGVELTYNAFRLPDGTINIGRITIPKP